MNRIFTWGGRSTFSYTGSVDEGTRIVFGANHVARVSAAEYADLLQHFAGRTVNVGTSRTDPPAGSVGEWLKANVTPTAIASYIGAILVHEGVAKRGFGADIKFGG